VWTVTTMHFSNLQYEEMLIGMMSTSIALEKTTNVLLAACKCVELVVYEKHEISLLQTMLRRLAVAT